jgi:hypothetical protein
MTDAPEEKKISVPVKIFWICAYGSVLIFYAVAGGVVLSLLLPSFPIWVLMAAACFVGSKLDYKFRGPASKLEQKYVAQMGK